MKRFVMIRIASSLLLGIWKLKLFNILTVHIILKASLFCIVNNDTIKCYKMLIYWDQILKEIYETWHRIWRKC